MPISSSFWVSACSSGVRNTDWSKEMCIRDSYTYQDEHGKSCDKWESFPTKEEAVKRQKQIEHELATGNFLIPSTVTVAEFLMDWLPKQCSKHKWAPKTYQSNLALIQNLIIPYIGEMQMQKLRPYHCLLYTSRCV